MRLLLTDTTWNMAILAQELRQAGFYVTEAANAAELREHLRLGEQDAVLIDPDLPDGEALDLIREIRSGHPRLPVCLFTRQVGDKLMSQALSQGADDVIRWPDHGIGDITARLRAYVRRAAGYATAEVTFGGLCVDLDRQSVRVGAMPVRLTRVEYELVETLTLRRGAVITRDQIMLQLYAWQDEPDAKIIDVYICRIRAKLAAAGAGEEVIATAFRQGYRLTALPQEVPALAA